MEKVAAIIGMSTNTQESKFDLSPESAQRKLVQMKADTINQMVGNLKGWDCKECKNRGYIAVVDDDGESFHTETCRSCATKRACLLKMERSGLRNVIANYTFDKFSVTEEWQKKIRKAAEDYAGNPNGKWFALFGQSGIGKTHLCTAICRKFLLGNRQVVYMPWRSDIEIIKSYENEERESKLKEVKNAEVLYIDDFLKTGAARDGTTRPTGLEVSIAYEIVNHRYINRLDTVFSSEFMLSEILSIDEAIGGRIAEMCSGNAISLNRDTKKNYRMRGTIA